VFNVVIDEELPSVEIEAHFTGDTLARPELVVRAKVADEGKSGLAMDTLRIAVDGQLIEPGNALKFDAKTGTITLPLAQPLLSNAQHAVQITVRDRAGNVSAPAVSVFNIVQDGEAPRIDVLAPAAGKAQPRDAAVLFAAAVYDLGRSGIDRATLAMAVDGKPIAPDDPKTPAIDGYRFVKGLLTHKLEGLGPGRHAVSLRAADGAGNAAQAVVWQFDVK